MKKIKKTKKKKQDIEILNIRNNIAVAVCVVSFVLLIILITSYLNINVEPSISDVKIQNKEFIYLSDIPYIKEQSSVGWGNLTLDANLESGYNNGMIALIVNGQTKKFFKGISAHATSTVIFDISEYNYDYFSTYYGIDASRGTNSDGVKFAIYSSVDGVTWDLHTPASPPIKKGNTESEFLNVDIKGKKYIKLYCLQYGNANSDHCAYGDTILYKEGYNKEENKNLDFIKTIEEYDNILKNSNLDNQLNNQELILLQRELVSRVGYDMLQGLANLDSDYEETLRWLMTDVNNLRSYLLGGTPDGGSYINSLKVLSRLYTNYKNDFNDQTISKYGNNVGNLYKTIAMALSLTHSQRVALWMQPSEETNQSDAVTRYAIFKKLYNEGKFQVSSSIDIAEWFETYTIEEMRFIMNNAIDDESIIWLNEYTQSQIDKNPNRVWAYLTPHPYMAYVWPNYGNPIFHDPDKKEYWDEKFNGLFSKYGITYTSGSNKIYKVWMNFRNEFGTGAVCGGISKTGSNIRTSHGIPASVIGQPGHAALLYYTQNSSGEGYWGIDNDVSGWTLSEKGERLLLGWGNNRNYNRGYAYNVPYIVMSQEAVNRFDKYQKSTEILYLSNIYSDDNRKKEEYIRASLNELDFNVDAWYSLIDLYRNDSSKTQEDFYNLAKEMSEKLVEYPLAYYNFMILISNNITDNEYKFSFNLLFQKTLTEGKNYKGNDVLQPGVTITMANRLLGQRDNSLATFSFNGEDAGKIVLSNKFDGSGIRWDYSLDGKNTWNEIYFTGNEEHKHKLSKKEIESITAENDIYIHIVGASYDEENILKIDITDNTITESSYFRNDLENRILGINLNHEWRNSEDEPWTSYAIKSPNNTGNKTLQIREAANGTKLASNILTFNFTENNEPDTRKYVPVSHLSIHAVSTEAVNNGGSATFAIDGNYNTRWHSAWNGTDTERYITIKLDIPMVISAVEFVPCGGVNGKIYDGTIYGSIDGENWKVLSRQTNLRYTNKADTVEQAIANTKSFEIENPELVQYVKIVADRTNGNWFTARAFNFFEDYTKNPNPTASIGFDVTGPTNGNVTARLINPSAEIRITNNGGSDTYVFTENGEFTFEFENVENGITGSTTARVTWIDKVAPTAEIKYNINTKTNKEVTATLVPSEDIIVLNNGRYDSDNENADPLTYMFMDNGEFTFEFRDAAGNLGYTTAKVDWIDLNIPNGTISYDINELTNKDVTATITLDKEDAKVTNNDGKNTYIFTENGTFTFIFTDEAGNTNKTTANVNWIDKVAPNAYIKYDKTDKTKGPVTATITSNEKIIITNNDGKDTYTFTENGEFDFTYVDMLGNKGKAKAKVDWIQTEGETPKPEEKPNENNPNNNEEDNKGNNQGNNENDKPEETPKYENFSFGNVSIKIDSKYIPEKVTFKKTRFTTTKALQKQFGENSDYIELYFENELHEKINLQSSDITITIKLEPDKEFSGIYELQNDKPKLLKHKNLEKNTVEFTVNNLDKYIIYYKEKEAKLETSNNNKRNYTKWFIAGGIILVSLTGIGAFITEKDKLKKNIKTKH